MGEIACNEMSEAVVLAGDDGAGDGEAGDDGAGDDDGAGEDDGAGDDGWPVGGAGVVLGEWALTPATLTENDLVARPVPPCHISKPASTSIKYHEGLM